jgi:hypothetical protein
MWTIFKFKYVEELNTRSYLKACPVVRCPKACHSSEASRLCHTWGSKAWITCVTIILSIFSINFNSLLWTCWENSFALTNEFCIIKAFKSLCRNVMFILQSVFRIGSGINQVSGSGSRRAKMTHKSRKN